MDWNFITAVATAIGAFSGLIFGVASIRQQRKSLDAETLTRLMDRSFEAERRFSNISKVDHDEKEWIANEHFNFLEGMACLYNNRLINKHSREWCKDILINHLAAIQIMTSLHPLLEISTTRVDTYKEIRAFLKHNKQEVNHLANFHGQLSNLL